MKNLEQTKETIAQEALRLLKDIPEDQWITTHYTNKVEKCCAIGHFNRLKSDNPEDYGTDNCADVLFFEGVNLTKPSIILRKTTSKYLAEVHKIKEAGKEFEEGLMEVDISSVNNQQKYNGYTEPVIKDRVIHLLTDMVEAGY